MEAFESRSGYLLEERHEVDVALGRLDVSKYIAAHYVDFAALSTQFQNNVPLNGDTLSTGSEAVRQQLLDHKMLRRKGDSFYPKNKSVARYLAGEWLEEYAWAACLEAGADAAVWGQRIRWNVGEYSGQNEVDVIAAYGDHLTFISCKALKPIIDPQNPKDQTKFRNLRHYLHEADDLADHFGLEGDHVVFLVSTDMVDEAAKRHRMPSMVGKAAALDVQVIGLEQLGWNDLIAAIGHV